MEITIKAEPKEIADLLNAIEGQQKVLKAYSYKPEIEVTVNKVPYTTPENIKEGVAKMITEYSELGRVKIKTSYDPPVPEENYPWNRQ